MQWKKTRKEKVFTLRHKIPHCRWISSQTIDSTLPSPLWKQVFFSGLRKSIRNIFYYSTGIKPCSLEFILEEQKNAHFWHPLFLNNLIAACSFHSFIFSMLQIEWLLLHVLTTSLSPYLSINKVQLTLEPRSFRRRLCEKTKKKWKSSMHACAQPIIEWMNGMG